MLKQASLRRSAALMSWPPSRILKNAANGVTDADKLRFVAIEEWSLPGGLKSLQL